MGLTEAENHAQEGQQKSVRPSMKSSRSILLAKAAKLTFLTHTMTFFLYSVLISAPWIACMYLGCTSNLPYISEARLVPRISFACRTADCTAVIVDIF